MTGTWPLAVDDLLLRSFMLSDLNDFSVLHADPDVMHDLGGPIDREEAESKLKGHISAFDRHGYGRMALFCGSAFAGYVGVMHHADEDHPLGPHDEIGWRLHRAFWGKGLASRAASLALGDAFDRVGLRIVLSYTAPDNHRSQAVMTRLGLSRAENLDFSELYAPVGTWHGRVWQVTEAEWAARHRAGGME